MQALLTLPKQLQDLPTRFNKINKTVYFEQKTQQFYKISALQPVTVFIGQDVVTRQNLVMTKYDPSFLVLHFISQNQSFSVNELPKYLPEQLFRKFTSDNGSTLKADKQKILEFIQQRIDKLTQLIEQKQYAKTAKKLNFVNKNKDMEKKQISFEVVDILRNDIPALYLQQLLTTRYHEQKFVKPVVVDEFVEEDDDKEDVRDKIKNKKKATSKPKIAQPLPKNQTTLFQFSSKKQAKGGQ